MPIAAVTGAISAGTSLLGGLFGSNAASEAAAKQAQAAQQAQQVDKDAANAANTAQQNATTTATANAQPYTSAGTSSINSLVNLLGNGTLTTPYSAFNPNAVNVTQDPGYQFQQQQGLNALTNSAAARGGLLSTGTAKNLLNYSQGLASTEYNNAYQRALQSYQTNASNYYTGQNNLFNRYFSLGQLGQNTTLDLNHLLQQGAQNTGNIDLTSAQMQGQQLNNAASAYASGIVGSNNALWKGIGGAVNGVNGILSTPNLFGSSVNPVMSSQNFNSGGFYSGES